jgi:hypothetical protein
MLVYLLNKTKRITRMRGLIIGVVGEGEE